MINKLQINSIGIVSKLDLYVVSIVNTVKKVKNRKSYTLTIFNNIEDGNISIDNKKFYKIN